MRMARLGVLFFGFGLVALDYGCNGSSTAHDDNGVAAGAGYGAPCSGTVACRPGLACGSANTCDFAHTTPNGAPCTINGQCTAGNVCDEVTHTCAPGGVGVSGDGCKHDADCKDGLRCTLIGFSAQCQPEGKGDLGGTCTTSSDCLGGLGCTGGKCVQGPPGVPPFGLSQWTGEACGKDDDAPVAYFRVPRGTDADGDFYRLPFPNDIRRTGTHPNLANHPKPGPELLGVDVVDRYLRALEKADGFGAYPTTIFRFSQHVNTDGFAPRIVDLTPGAADFGTGYALVSRDGAGKYECDNVIAVRPPLGDALIPGHTYAVLIGSTLHPVGGGTFAHDPDFDAMLADGAPADAALAAAYPTYAPLRAWMKAQSMAPASLVNAAVFTVGGVDQPAKKLAKTAAAAPPPTATGWVKCGAGPSPCPDATGTRGCDAAADPDFDEWHALVTLPIYQAGKAPYLTPDDGGGIDTSGDTVAKVRDEQVCMAVTVPHGAPPMNGWPSVVYAHGTGGSFRSHIGEGVAKMLATAPQPMVVIGIDQVQHGPRRNGSTQSPNDLFYNFMNPAAALGNPLQGAADQLALSRYAATAQIDGVPLDKDTILFWGHSQGATEGAIAVPYTGEIKGAVLSGEGASLIDGLLNKTSPVNIAAVVPFALQDVDPLKSTWPFSGPFHPVLSIIQQYIDPADPLNHAVAMAQTPPMGLSGHHVFQVFGTGDTFAPPVTEATYAAAAWLPKCAADGSAGGGDPAFPKDYATLPSPVKGNFTATSKPLTAAVREYGPSGYDGHFVAFKNDAAKADVVRFLSQLAAGGVPQIGPLHEHAGRRAHDVFAARRARASLADPHRRARRGGRRSLRARPVGRAPHRLGVRARRVGRAPALALPPQARAVVAAGWTRRAGRGGRARRRASRGRGRERDCGAFAAPAGTSAVRPRRARDPRAAVRAGARAPRRSVSVRRAGGRRAAHRSRRGQGVSLGAARRGRARGW